MDVTDLNAGRFEILLAHPSYAQAVARDRSVALSRLHLLAPSADNLRGEPGPNWRGYRVDRKAALIPVMGALIPNGPVGMARMGFGVTSYEGLRDQLRQATSDDSVSTILLMIDSPGGMVTGIDATSAAILAARRVKPVIAVVEGMAASAAYWLASQCDSIIAAPLGYLGSIGALQVHVDLSRALDAGGVTVTIIRAGARKAEGNPYEQLGEDARADLQASVDTIRGIFAEAVATGRNNPALGLAAVLATEARMFDAHTAVSMGLADRIGTLDNLLDGSRNLTAWRKPIASTSAALGTPPFQIQSPEAIPAKAHGIPELQPSSPATNMVADPAIARSVREIERERLQVIFQHPTAKHPAGRAYAEREAYETNKSAEEVCAGLDAVLPIIEESEARAAKSCEPTLAEEMAADPSTHLALGVGSEFHRPAEMNAEQKGAFHAAQLLAKVGGREPQR